MLVGCWTYGQQKNNLVYQVPVFTSGVDHRKNYSRRFPSLTNSTDVGHWPGQLRPTCTLRRLQHLPIQSFGLNLDFRVDKLLLLWAVRSLIKEPICKSYNRKTIWYLKMRRYGFLRMLQLISRLRIFGSFLVHERTSRQSTQRAVDPK